MILYALAAIALFVFLAVRTALDAKPGADPQKRTRVNLVLGLAGAGITALAFGLGMLHVTRLDDGGWAFDVFTYYYLIALPVCAAVIVLLILASLGARTSVTLRGGLFPRFRVLANLLSSAFTLLLTPFYAALTDGASVPIRPLLLVSGIGISLLFRLALLVEYRVRRS